MGWGLWRREDAGESKAMPEEQDAPQGGDDDSKRKSPRLHEQMEKQDVDDDRSEKCQRHRHKTIQQKENASDDL